MGLTGVGVGLVVARALDHRGDHRGLRRRDLAELAGVQAEVDLGRRGGTIGATAEVDRVQVLLEDPLLGLGLGELLRNEDFLDLAARGLRRADVVVVVPDQLLGDGGSALQVPAGTGEVVVGGADDTGRRDAALVPEVLVLGRHHRVAQHRRELAVGEDHPVGLAELAHLGLAVAEVDLGCLLHDGRLDIGDGGLGVGVRHPHRDHDDEEADDARDDGQHLLPGPVPPPAALAARCFAARVVRPAPVAAAVAVPAPGRAGALVVPVAADAVAAQPFAQVVPDVADAGAEPGCRAAAGAALTPGARTAVPGPRPPRPVPVRCAAPPRRVVVLADPAAGAVGRGRRAAPRRSITPQGPPR